MEQHEKYVMPTIEILDITIERGFANSLEDPYEKPKEEW